MADKPSEASPYKSRFAEGLWISCEQYIAETLTARLARKQGKELPPRFWNMPAWKRTFLNQVRLAAAILKIYDRKAVFAALRREKNVFSLNNKWLDPILQEEQEKLDRQAEQREAKPQTAIAVERPTEPVKPREVYNPEKSLLARLRELDA